jgi:hypothetical protein
MSHLMQPNSGSQQMTSSMGGQQQIQQQLQQQQPIMGQSSQPQAMSTTNTVQTQQPNAEQRYDLIARVRSLVWSLKDSLAVNYHKF